MNQEIYEKLREMRLPIMAEEYKDLMLAYK